MMIIILPVAQMLDERWVKPNGRWVVKIDAVSVVVGDEVLEVLSDNMVSISTSEFWVAKCCETRVGKIIKW